MNTLTLLRLFRMLLSPGVHVNPAAIEQMGLLAVKIAQMYAVRPDLVGERKCTQLTQLFQRVTPMSGAEFNRRLSLLAPSRFLSAMAKLEESPLAAASLGQVHRATLRDGQQVVVKLARQEFRAQFLSDVRQFRKMLRLALLVYPTLERLADPVGALKTVERQTLKEMNFLEEIAGARRLETLASHYVTSLPHLQRLHFPGYLPEFSNEGLVVSQFIRGHTLAELLEQGALPYDALLDLFRIHGFFLFVTGEFHGDLHPGNVIWRDGHFWFLDNANIETIPPNFSRGLFEMLVLLGRGEMSRAAAQLAALSTTPLTTAKQSSFRSDFVALYRGYERKPVKEASLTQQMMQTVKLAVAHGISFPKGAFPLIKSLMYLDGMALRAAPNAFLLQDVAQFAADFPRIESSPDEPTSADQNLIAHLCA